MVILLLSGKAISEVLFSLEKYEVEPDTDMTSIQFLENAVRGGKVNIGLAFQSHLT